MRKMCFAAVLLVPALAMAQPRTAVEWYNEGENQFNLGAFEKAAEAFKQGFALENSENKKPAYLFNIAQSYRMANDCKNAHFFYKRFLAVQDNLENAKPLSSKVRKDVEERIAELEQCANQAASISRRPPNSLRTDDNKDGKDKDGKDGDDKKPDAPPSGKKPVATAGGTGEEDDGDTGEVKAQVTTRPHLVVVRLTGGGTKINAGSPDVPIQATGALTVGYPIPVAPQVTVEAGAALSFAPVPYTNEAMGGKPAESRTAVMTSLMANAAGTYEVIPKLGVRVDVGLGVLLLSNVSDSFFTDMQPTSGALTMFHVRGALSAEYAVTPNFIVTAPSLAFSYSPPKDGLSADIKSITAFDFMVGVSYRM
ncbi:MAG TPA: tetratricopeptide repeat protein [Kofleriaceae bacterium]